jgi:hypothetical protein
MIVPEKRVAERYPRDNIRVDNRHIESVLKWLTDRDILILRYLNRYPFLTTGQIEMFVFNNLKPSSWRNKSNERLRKLYKAHLVDRWYPPTAVGSAESHYVLDVGGAKILALKGTKEMEKWRKRDYVPQTYTHTLKIIDFRAMLSVLQKQESFEVLTFRTEKKNAMEYPMNGGKKGEVQPDALCIYKSNNRIKAFFLECDNGTMTENQLKSKIIRYNQLFKSEEWKKTDWAQKLKAFLPIVFVMRTEEDIRNLNAYTSKLESNIKFYYTTYDDLIEKDTIIYENRRGKTREVPQAIRIRLLEAIWTHGEGKVNI